MFLGVERTQLAIDWTATPGKLRLIVRFKRDDVKAIATDGKRSRILSRNGERADHSPRDHIDHSNLILRRQHDVGFLVARKGHPHRFIEAGGSGDRIKVLHRGDDL